MKTFGIFLVIAVGLATATTPEPSCLTDDDCSATECCYKKHEYLIVSKRQGTFEGHPIPHQDLAHTRGVCQSYHTEGQPCSPFDKANGYCSCNEKAGHSCTLEASDELLASKRVALYPGMGAYTCQKTVN